MTKYRRGFTLVELLVAITLFSVAIAIGIGGFVRALRTQRQLVGLIAANSNASLAIEEMAREIRTGRDFKCVGGLSPCKEITFTNANDEIVDYSLNETAEGWLERNQEKVTAGNVRVAALWFTLMNDPSFPARVTVSMSVGSTNADIKSNLTNIETTVSSRAF